MRRLQTISEIFPKEPWQNGSTPKFLAKPILTLGEVNSLHSCRLLNSFLAFKLLYHWWRTFADLNRSWAYWRKERNLRTYYLLSFNLRYLYWLFLINICNEHLSLPLQQKVPVILLFLDLKLKQFSMFFMPLSWTQQNFHLTRNRS